jgi:hypothetical protein
MSEDHSVQTSEDEVSQLLKAVVVDNEVEMLGKKRRGKQQPKTPVPSPSARSPDTRTVDDEDVEMPDLE